MLKIGITGGIGSGKTTVCRIFEKLGIPIYYADDRAKKLMVEKKEIINQVKKIFGKRAYYKNGKLNRKHISKIAFSNPEKLHALNAIVHPAVEKDATEWSQRQKNTPYTIKEAALIFESGSHRSLDKIITVTAPQLLRIQRVMQRDQTTEAAVLARISKQMPEEEKVKKSDFIILNDGSESLILQIWKIHQQLKSLSQQKNSKS